MRFTSVRIGALFALLSITCVYFLPATLSLFPIESCSPEGVAQHWCQNRNVWMTIPDLVMGEFALFGLPMFFGIVLGLVHHRTKKSWRASASSVLANFVIFVLLTSVFEVLWLQPWKLQRFPNGTMFNEFDYDALFATGLVLAIFTLALIAYLLTRLGFYLASPSSKKTLDPVRGD